MKMIKFWLDGCDICFIAEAPEDITLKQLLKQTDKIEPNYCACGIRSLTKEECESEWLNVEIRITYDGIEKVDEKAPCTIKEGGAENETD